MNRYLEDAEGTRELLEEAKKKTKDYLHKVYGHSENPTAASSGGRVAGAWTATRIWRTRLIGRTQKTTKL